MLGVISRKVTQLFTQRLKGYDITPEQWVVLYRVQQQNGMIQKEIAERSGKDRPTTTRILDVLESKQLVLRKTGESDRRSFLVYATDKGRELIRQTEAIERLAMKDATAGFSREEHELLLKLLYRIGQNVDNLTGGQ
jgi:DNA-binding MarR family transcriptional regulator